VGDFFLGVLGLAGFIGIAWLILKAQSGASRAVNRAVFKNRHQQGQGQVGSTTTFSSAGNMVETMNAIVRSVNAHEEPPTLVPGLYLASRGPGRLIFRYGSKISDSFEARVSLTDDGGKSCSGQVSITNWTEVDGLVSNVDQMTRLRARITIAVKDVAPAASTRPVGTASSGVVVSASPVADVASLAGIPDPSRRGGQPSAGWYRDPLAGERYRLRYWDGEAWTERVD
jgi:Protein of unknown function (DUF2510)